MSTKKNRIRILSTRSLSASFGFAVPLLVFLLFSLSSCQTFPQGKTLNEAQQQLGHSSSEALAGTNVQDDPEEGIKRSSYGQRSSSISPVDLSPQRLYKYFSMCLAVWRIRDSWRDSGWDLDYIYDEKTNALALAIKENNTLYISFRSSQALEDRTDLKYNARFLMRRAPFLPDSKIKAYSGFLSKYEGIRERLLKRVKDAESSGVSRVLLLGHSGGGPMAGITFLDLKHHFTEIEIEGIVFGMVRTFNRHGAAWFREHEDSYIRIVNGRDLFSNVPPVLFGYRHVGKLVRIGSRPVYKLFSFKDHHPGYRTEIEELLREDGINPDDLRY